MRGAVCRLSVILVASCPSAFGLTMLHYTSDPSSYVGAGETWTVTPYDGFTFDPGFFNTYSTLVFSIDNFSTAAPADYAWWSFKIQAPTGETLHTGSYEGAARFASAGTPGLDFNGNGRGNNTLTGRFDVLEIEFDGSGHITKLAVDFTQYDEGNLAWGVYGNLRYNSSIGVSGVADGVPATSPRSQFILWVMLGILGVWALARAGFVKRERLSPPSP